MNLSSCNGKAQKGWLSRWTRKQWSRHWFVLKNGSLTYYRGPAAELCSFLDGVLDLSLIKQIEVQQQEANNEQQHHSPASNANSNHHHHLSHHHHLTSGQTQSHQNNAGAQFTFSLRMWNGECHLLGAGSQAERSVWLEAIKSQSSGQADDEAATDSASSSDSSPASNLSAKSADIGRPLLAARGRYQQQQHHHQDQLCLDALANTLRSAIKQREQDLLLELTSNDNSSSKSRLQLEPANRHNKPIKQHQLDLSQTQEANQINRASSQPLVEPKKPLEPFSQERKPATAQAPHLEKPDAPLIRQRPELYQTKASYLAKAAAGQTNCEPQEQAARAAEPKAEGSALNRNELANEQTKQKKRVTFDLSLSSHHQLTSGSSASSCNGSSSDSDDSSLSSSSSVSSSSSSASSDLELDDDDDDNNDNDDDHNDDNNDGQAQSNQVDEVADEMLGKEKPQEEACEASIPIESPIGDLLNLSDDEHDDNIDVDQEPAKAQCNYEPGMLAAQLQAAPADGAALAPTPLPPRDGATGATQQLEARLEQAQSSIGLLEKKLTNSYANYGQLELSYKRIQAELVKGDECHKGELTRLQTRVDELTRDLATSELKLVETREKLLKYEQQISKSIQNQQQQQAKPISHNKTLNWLRASQQVAQPLMSSQVNQHHHQHQHQPLLLMHHVKHTLATNQQTLGIKLLNHSKQIQRKLNELELKVDKMQQTGTSSKITTPTSMPSESSCVK